MNKQYRNTEPLGDIPEGSLWTKTDHNFVLVDEDQYRWLPIECWQHLFTEVE